MVISALTHLRGRRLDPEDPELSGQPGEDGLFDTDVQHVRQRASTGHLPPERRVGAVIDAAYARYLSEDEGSVADYIPLLAEADPDQFGLVLAGVNGRCHAAGDSDAVFSIQSISKAFVFALACDAFGHEEVYRRIGVNNTGLPFNSVIAVELNGGSPMNPMVNAGAIATTSMIPGDSREERWRTIHDGLGRFAGRELELDEAVYRSETATNDRNHALARLLRSYGRIECDADDAVDIYTRQCALSVTAADLAVMGATIAGGGVNPITGERVVSTDTARDTLAVLAACGMYEHSGEWLFEIGIPAKSGVAGGIVAIAPGKGALGSFSPRLDSAGNSVRGLRACAYLSRSLGLNLFASAAHPSFALTVPDAVEAAI